MAPETKRKISEANTGKRRSEQLKLEDSRRRRKNDGRDYTKLFFNVSTCGYVKEDVLVARDNPNLVDPKCKKGGKRIWSEEGISLGNIKKELPIPPNCYDVYPLKECLLYDLKSKVVSLGKPAFKTNDQIVLKAPNGNRKKVVLTDGTRIYIDTLQIPSVSNSLNYTNPS